MSTQTLGTIDVIQALKAGRKRLADGYLIKGKYEDHEGGYCAFGAVVRPKEPLWEIRSAAHESLNNAGEDLFGHWGIIKLNDRESITKEHVLEIYDLAIKNLEEGK